MPGSGSGGLRGRSAVKVFCLVLFGFVSLPGLGCEFLLSNLSGKYRLVSRTHLPLVSLASSLLLDFPEDAWRSISPQGQSTPDTSDVTVIRCVN